MKFSRQHVLIVVLGLLLVVVVFQYLPSSAGGGPPRGSDIRAVAADLDLPPELETDLLTDNVVRFDPSGGRNLFVYGEPPRPEAPPNTASKPTRKPRSAIVKPPTQTAGGNPNLKPPPPPPPQRPTAPQPPKVDFQYIGYIGPADGRIAIFTIRTEDGTEIAMAREGEVPRIGEVIDLEQVQQNLDRFMVRRIGYEDVEMGYTEELFAEQSTTLFMGGRT